jgi:hypothetical protein
VQVFIGRAESNRFRVVHERRFMPQKKEKRHNKVAVAPLMDGKTMGQIADRVGVGNDTRRFI